MHAYDVTGENLIAASKQPEINLKPSHAYNTAEVQKRGRQTGHFIQSMSEKVVR